MSPTSTFWTEPSGRTRRWLRRYVSSHDGGYTCADGWHEAMQLLDDVDEGIGSSGDLWPHDDERWPAQCAQGCGYTFTEDDVWQLFASRLYRRPETGDEWPLRDLPAGAMYDADWMGDWAKGSDGICLVVILPTEHRHPWMVDSEASNCTRKGDRTHKCWIRHGNPRTESVTVDKDGDTCDAGAGSIAADGYHGFLRDGVLTHC